MKRFLTTEQALAQLFEEEPIEERDMVIIPPNPSAVSDEKDFDENDLTNVGVLPSDTAGELEIHNSQFGIFKHHLSIDEQMIPYRGRHSCKMFIKGKPIRFGYKSWILASSDGYVFSFDIYQGKSENKYEYGLGGKVIIKLLKALQKPNYHKIYFDNFFTSFKLLSYLKQMGYFATGTVRDNRIEHCPVESIKVVAKKERGYYDYRFEKLNEIFVVRWNDNSVVTVASTCHTISLLSNVSRYSKKISSKIKIPQPNMVTAYNKHMGGVDLCDNLISTYRIKIRGKKWWWPIFTNFIDVALVNSWKIWKFVNRDDKKSLLAFRREVTNYLLRTPVKIEKNSSTGHASQFALQCENPIDSSGHYLSKIIDGKRRRWILPYALKIYVPNMSNRTPY
ncbi:piggyBac transposable element-derived protein 3-like [Gordionus sp. m RMFG-2023]|uniref:piggyBac transposable element-derived protein 3-like n=1 Tax=Gordionus sp. m RMFG-2023 TaxID=3053472 RepID=UPI0031FDC21A